MSSHRQHQAGDQSCRTLPGSHSSTASHGPQDHLLTKILRIITGSPNNKTAWLELLHFGPVILDKPKRGGSKRNLSNIINSRTAARDKDAVPTVHSQTTDSRTSRSQTTTASYLQQYPASWRQATFELQSGSLAPVTHRHQLTRTL